MTPVRPTHPGRIRVERWRRVVTLDLPLLHIDPDQRPEIRGWALAMLRQDRAARQGGPRDATAEDARGELIVPPPGYFRSRRKRPPILFPPPNPEDAA
jgi:hypothetical protein